MSEEDKTFDRIGASTVTDYAIRRSLLARADAVEQAKFEALLMLDDGFERRVHRLELELADDFSFGSLSSEEQQLFKTRFLVTPGRVRELAVSEALRKVISSKSTSRLGAAGRPWNLSSLSFFAFDRPFASVVLGGVALFVFGALFWLSQKAPPVRPPAISKKQSIPSPEKQYAHPVVSPDTKDGSANDRGAQQQQVSSITLEAEGRATSQPTVQLPAAGSATVRLELLVDAEVAPGSTYDAKLMSADGKQEAAFSELKLQPGTQPKVVVDLHNPKLKTGDYWVELRRVSEAGTQETARYSFNVKQE